MDLRGRAEHNLVRLLQHILSVRMNPISVGARYVYYYLLSGARLVANGNVEIRGARNIRGSRKPVYIGIKQVGFESRHDRTLINCRGRLRFLGGFSIGRGCRFDVGPGAEVVLGDGSYINSGSLIVIMHGMEIGRDCAISWNCQFLDENFHQVNYPDGPARRAIGERNKIVLGDRVWVGCNAIFLPGAEIASDCIVAANSVVTKAFQKSGCLIGGNPARVLREGVSWT